MVSSLLLRRVSSVGTTVVGFEVWALALSVVLMVVGVAVADALLRVVEA